MVRWSHRPSIRRSTAALLAAAAGLWLWLCLVSPVTAQTPPTPGTSPISRQAATPVPTPSGWPTLTPRATLPATPGTIPMPGSPPDPGNSVIDPWVWLRSLFDQLGALATQALLAVIETLVWPIEQFIAHWPSLARQYDFLTTTSPDHTYNARVVTDARVVMTGIANAALALLTLVAGHTLMARQSLDLDAEPPITVLGHLVLAALAANTAGWWTARLIDLNNALIAAFAPAPLDALLHQVSPVDRVSGLLFFLILMVAMTILVLCLIVQMLMRLVLVDLLLIVAPLALVLLALPQTRGWTGLWSRLFTTTVLAQALQLIAIALATQLGSSLFGPGQSGVTLLAALAILYLTLKLPGLLQHGLGSVGLAAVGGLSAASSVFTTVLVTGHGVSRLRSLTSSATAPEPASGQPAPSARHPVSPVLERGTPWAPVTRQDEPTPDRTQDRPDRPITRRPTRQPDDEPESDPTVPEPGVPAVRGERRSGVDPPAMEPQ